MDTNINNSIPALINLAKDEQNSLRQWATKISARQDVINRVIELLEAPIFNDSIELPSSVINAPINNRILDKPKNGIREKYFDYPRRGSRQEKIRYILRKEDMAMLSPQIQDLIMKIEGPARSRDTLKNFYNVITSMVTYKEILSGRVVNRRYTFYILPEFLDDNNKLKLKHYPREESWGKLEVQLRNTIADCFRN